MQESGKLGLTIESRPAEAKPTGESGWSGLSGAAVISDRRLVGIVTDDPAHFNKSVNALRVDAFWPPDGLVPFLETAKLETVTGTEYEPGLRDLRLDLPQPAADFVGREDDLQTLGRTAADATVVAQAVAGLGGVGKSALALEYGYWLYREQSVDLAWWFSAQDPAVMYEAMAARYRAITGVETDSAELGARQMRNWLQDCEYRWLVIFDNADTDDAVEAVAQIMPLSESGQTVITSRRQDWADRGVFVHQLQTLDATDALHLLERRAQRPADRDAERLVDELGGLALALEIAGTFIRKTKITYRAYRDQLLAHPADVLGVGGTDRGVALVWRSSMSHVTSREPASRTLLGVLCYLDGDPIPRPLLDSDAVAGVPELRVMGEFALAQALGELADYSLITLTDNTITIHRLISELTRLQLAADQQEVDYAYAAVLLLTALFAKLDELHLSPQDLLGHVLAATGNDLAVLTGSPGVVFLLNTAAEYFLDLRQFDTAKTLNVRASALADRYLSPDYPWTLRAQADSARLAGEAGRVDDAIGQYRKVLDAHIRAEGPGSPNVLSTLANLANLAGQIGPVDDAIAQYRRLLGDYTKLVGADQPATFAIRSNLARLTGLAGKAADAMTQYGQLLKDRTRVLGADQLDTLATRVSLASLTGEIGRVDDAITQYQQLVKDYTRVLGANHRRTLTIRGKLADLTGRAGRVDDAIGQLRLLVEDCTKVRGADDPDTLATRGRLADLTGQAGRVDGAIAQYQQLIDDQLRVLGADNPQTLSARASMARLTGKAGRVNDAIGQLQRLVDDYTRVRGADHPLTLSTRSGIARMTGEVGRFDDAIAQYQQLVADYTRVRGAGDPETLSDRTRLAEFTAKAGRVDDAISQLQRLVDDCTRVRGADHPQTLFIRASVARLTGEVRHFDDAIAQYQLLVDDYTRVHGADHRNTLTMRANLADVIGRAGRVNEAVALLRQVADDRIRLFGADDPDVHSVNNLLAYWNKRSREKLAR
jgi:tetratricopeptide (TPR) repeat protein